MPPAPLPPAPVGDAEARPVDFRGRFARRAKGIGQRRTAPARRRRDRTLAATALAIVALPAFASPGNWERFSIGNAGASGIAVEPMPFEQAGASFPGSAFYYLQPDLPEPGSGIAGGTAGGKAIRDVLDPGPAARALHVLGGGANDSASDRSRALQCLTAAIYYEAASEPDAGQRAVAQVVLNRVAHPTYPATVCGVVYEGSQRHTGCQFSFTCDGALARRPAPYFWHRAEEVARAALSGEVYAPVGLATHYHTLQVHPYWAPSLHALTTIGAHRFYSLKGPAGQPATFRFAYHGGEPGPRERQRAPLDTAPEAASDPVAIQNAYANAASGQTPAGDATTEPTLHGPAETARGLPKAPSAVADKPLATKPGTAQPGTAAAPASSNRLPESSGIRPEFRNSGRWIGTPGTP